jgi:RimJ/RimL family protein N-acetyltransferase
MGLLFETDRLIVRTYETDDAEADYQMYRDPDVWTYLGVNRPYTSIDDARAAIARRQTFDQEKSGYGSWAVVVRDTGELIGTVLIAPLEEGPEIEVGYILAKRAWGMGYGTEVCRAAIAYGFRTLPVDQLVGVVFPENVASQNVITKAGMTFQGMRHTFGFDLRYYTVQRPDQIPCPAP